MSQPIRAFVAVPIAPPEPLLAVLRELDDMGRAVKAVAADRMHVTLKFLGDTPPERIAEIGRVVAEVGRRESAFELEIAGLGAFPTIKRPSVVWAGLERAEPLARMAAALDEGLEPLGCPREQRQFQPHLTLARVRFKPPAELRALFDAHAAVHFGTARIDAVELMQSELGPGEAIYTVLVRGPLSASI